MWFFNILVVVISYFIASINPAIIISNKVLNKDIRELGSKNAGTTNSIRIMGKKIATKYSFCIYYMCLGNI